MGSDPVISLQGISKRYRRYANPTHRLWELLFPGHTRAEEFWALQSIDLVVHRGQTVGIIGHNGSGKSTLLQIIAGTLTPSSGKVAVQGRVSALLELGSGFNPEFTGRQNIYFNGKVLGLSSDEINARFDQISAFADIGDFLEQPVKTYSSGMFVRLAFAIAVSVEPDILIIDEALAVGDIHFQQKCFTRLAKLKEQGVTLLFVSHDMTAVYRLCDCAVLMESGKAVLTSRAKEVIELYEAKALKSLSIDSSIEAKLKKQSTDSQENCQMEAQVNYQESRLESRTNILGEKNIKSSNTITLKSPRANIKFVKILDENDQEIQVVICDQMIKLCISVVFLQAVIDPIIGFQIRDRTGLILFQTNTYMMGSSIGSTEVDTIVNISFSFIFSLAEGEYTITIGLANQAIGHWSFEEVLFQVNDAYSFKALKNQAAGIWFGLVNLAPTLSIEKCGNTMFDSL